MANEIKKIRLKDDEGNTLRPQTEWSLIVDAPEIPEIPDVTVNVTGTGNAVTAASASGHSITLTKGSSFSLDGHKHVVADITDFPEIPVVNNGNLYLQANGTTKQTFTANQAGNTTFNIATGSTNGTISVAGTNVSVSGLGSAAFTESTAYLGKTETAADADKLDGQHGSYYATAQSVEDLKGLISSAIKFKGTKETVAEIKAITTAEIGDLWIATEDGSEWVCKEKLSGLARAGAWEELGHVASGTVIDPNYKHITVTSTSVSDGTNTFNKYSHPENYTAHTSDLYKFANDKYGHVSSATKVTKADITALGIPEQDTTYAAGTGLSLSGTTFNHSNSVTPISTLSLLKVKYDAQGHITDSTNVTKADITGLGIPGQDTTYTAGEGLNLTGNNQFSTKLRYEVIE